MSPAVFGALVGLAAARTSGMAMNPIDRMGGGQGKGGGGRHHSVSPWGQLAKGFKTRRKHKPSDRFIVQRRKSKVKG
jgi:large subunit ribosomal protein L2